MKFLNGCYWSCRSSSKEPFRESNQLIFRDITTGFLTKRHPRNKRRKANFQPLRTTTQIWVVTCQRYGIFVLALQSSFRGKSVVTSLSGLGRIPIVRTDLQTIPVVMRISLSILSSQISQILNSMHKVNGFPAKTLGKSGFNLLTDWSGQPVLTNRKCNTQKVPSFFCEILTVFPGYWLLDGIFFIITCQCQLIL